MSAGRILARGLRWPVVRTAWLEVAVVTAGWPDWGAWTNVHVIRARLDVGADPNARLPTARNTPLHAALWEVPPVPEVVEELVANGADVEAVNEFGETPLWCAVRRGCAASVRALLRVGADPWRPSVGGRSPGRMALDGPLAGLFAGLPGAPPISLEQRRRQAEADELIASCGDVSRVAPNLTNICVAFVAGIDEDEVIRRIGARPADCPLASGDECLEAFYGMDPAREAGVLWVGTPPGGGVVIHHEMGTLPVEDPFCARVSAGGAVLACTFDDPVGDDQRVRWWRDGELLATPSPYLDPEEHDPPEAWLCRFGDYADESPGIARGLALMTMLTGVRPDTKWLGHERKRLVRAPARLWRAVVTR